MVGTSEAEEVNGKDSIQMGISNLDFLDRFFPGQKTDLDKLLLTF